MADDTRFEQDPLVEALIDDPKQLPDLSVLWGYLGASTVDTHSRVYGNPQLSVYLEIQNDAIRYVERGERASDGSCIWVPRLTEATYGDAWGTRQTVRVADVVPAAGGFGAFTAGAPAAGGASAASNLTNCPCCACVSTAAGSLTNCPCCACVGTVAATTNCPCCTPTAGTAFVSSFPAQPGVGAGFTWFPAGFTNCPCCTPAAGQTPPAAPAAPGPRPQPTNCPCCEPGGDPPGGG